MIKHIPFSTLGKANYGWLKANYHFSFAQYYNPERMGFGKLRVINDDKIEPGAGFPPHPHANMEIITFVRSGAVSHKDNQGNQGVTQAGEVQVMSAGTGIQHSEYNLSKDPLTLFQIWVEPHTQNVEPRWETKNFRNTQNNDVLPLLVSGNKSDKEALFIYQDIKIYGGKLSAKTQINQNLINQAYILTSNGKVTLKTGEEEIELSQGDGAEVTNVTSISIEALIDSEILILDVPTK